jgi:ABC-type transport system substrate-binding protein
MGGADRAIYIAADLGRVGVRMNIVTLEGSVTYQRVTSGDYEAALKGMGTGWGDVPNPKRVLEAAGYTNRRFIELEERILAALDPNEEDRLYRELTQLFQHDVPATFLYPAVRTTIASTRVRGLADSPYRGDLTRCMDSLSLEGVS